MKNNNHGRGSGLALIMLLIAALVVAWLAVQQMGSLGMGSQETEPTNDSVQQAEDMVDQYNDQLDEYMEQADPEHME